MAKLYNFNRLIDKYSVDFVLVSETDGEYVSGKYVKGETSETPMRGAWVPISDQKQYQSGGTYTEKDYTVYMRYAIPEALRTAKAVFKGNEYSLEQAKNFEDYADAYIYTAKWVGAVRD